MTDIVSLCYEDGLRDANDCLTADLFYRLTRKQRSQTTWCRETKSTGKVHFYFQDKPSWLQLSNRLGLQFLVAVCGGDDMWQGRSFSSVIAHATCPFCQCPGFVALPRWEHMLGNCPGVASLADGWGLSFVP